LQLLFRTTISSMQDKEITADYCLQHTTPVAPVLEQLERATHLYTLSPVMASGPYQGMLLQFISYMIKPKRVLEIGAFTGYAAICLAQGLPEDGLLHTIEVNDELAWIAKTHFEKAGLAHKIILHHGDAALVAPNLGEWFDLVLLDAGKLDYPEHYELALSIMKSGAFLIADNVLWDGKVASGDTRDETAVLLRHFNTMVQSDDRVENILLPIRDGLMLVRKK
jgi:caffeoyl-CoA O-methyltransferase